MPTRAGAVAEAAAGDSSASTGFFAISPLKWRTPLVMTGRGLVGMRQQENLGVAEDLARKMQGRRRTAEKDRESTRLNSSHSQISYAVFCLKKKKETVPPAPQ